MKAIGLDNITVAMIRSRSLTIFEAKTEENAAQSIYLTETPATRLRDFLNEEFPTPEAEKYKAVIGTLQWIAQNPGTQNVHLIAQKAMDALGWEDK